MEETVWQVILFWNLWSLQALSQTPAGAPRVSRASRGPCPRGVLAARHTPSVDLLGPAMAMLSQLPGETPLDIPGLVVNRDFDSV